MLDLMKTEIELHLSDGFVDIIPHLIYIFTYEEIIKILQKLRFEWVLNPQPLCYWCSSVPTDRLTEAIWGLVTLSVQFYHFLHGLIAQLVEHCTSIEQLMGFNPV